jgi:L-threonylcarbamoyladenylate synthase
MDRGADADAFERCIAGGGVAVFPADTVYGLACDPDDEAAVRRLYALKGRAPDKPSAVMFFDLDGALAALPELGEPTRRVFERLLPGPVSLVVGNPRRRFALACGPDPESLGVRVPVVERLAGVSRPVLQSSANLAGGPDAVCLADVPESIRAGADVVIDGGRLPGTPSTVIDLRAIEHGGEWRVLREGALAASAVSQRLSGALAGRRRGEAHG